MHNPVHVAIGAFLIVMTRFSTPGHRGCAHGPSACSTSSPSVIGVTGADNLSILSATGVTGVTALTAGLVSAGQSARRSPA
jgi:hypothetical protein